MNDTNNSQTETAVREQLARLEWMVSDAKRDPGRRGHGIRTARRGRGQTNARR